MKQEKNDIHHGKIEILGKPKNGANIITSADIHVKLDGKVIPHLQKVEVVIDVASLAPKVVLTMFPSELVIELDGIEVHEE